MKKIIISFLCFIFCFGIGLGLSQVKVEQQVSAATNFENVKGARFRSYWSIPNCGLTFEGTMPSTADYSKVRLFLAPYDYVTGIRNGSNATAKTYLANGDYVNAFSSAGKQYVSVEPIGIVSGGTVTFRAGIKNIKDVNLNRGYFGIYYYETATPGVYEYASMENEEDHVRSMAYMASGYYPTAVSASIENDVNMTTHFMQKSIQNALSRAKISDVDLTSIQFATASGKIVEGTSSLTATYFDDYVDGITYKINYKDSKGASKSLANAQNYLDFYPTLSYTSLVTKLSDNLINVTGTGSTTYSVQLGKDVTTGLNLTVNKYNLSTVGVTLTATNVTFTDTLSTATANKLTDTYKTTNVTPSYTLTIPKTNKMLSQKTFNYSQITSMGNIGFTTTSPSASYEDNGANGSLTYADTENLMTINVKSTLSGGNFANSVIANSTATKNYFTVGVHYKYYDKYDTVDGSTAKSSFSNTYYYGQTYNLVQEAIEGYPTYKNNDRTNEVTTSTKATVSGDATSTIYYMPETYSVTVGYSGATSNPEDDIISVKCGYPYKFNVPVVNGYYTETASVSGTMGSSNLTKSVVYTAVNYTSDTGVYFDCFDNTTAQIANIGATFVGYGGAIGATTVGSFTNTNYVDNRYYIVKDGAFLKTNVIYLEYMFKLDDISSDQKWAKMGIVIEPANNVDNKKFIYIDALSGADDSVEGTHKGWGVASIRTDPKLDTYTWMAEAKYMPNYRQNYIKISLWKTGDYIQVSVNESQVFNSHIGDINTDCYFGFMSYATNYTVSNVAYKLSGGVTGTTISDGEYVSNTLTATNFYAEVNLKANEVAGNNVEFPKLGITVYSAANRKNRLFFYMDLLNGKQYSETNADGSDKTDSKRLGLSMRVNGTDQWYSDYTGANDWYGSEKSVSVSPTNSNPFIGGENVFSVFKEGKTLTFMLNKIPYLQVTNSLFEGECTVGVMTYQFNTTFKDYMCITDSEKLSQIKKERGLNSDGLEIDGSITSAEWALAGNKIVGQMVSNGEGYKYGVFAGSTFIYILAEAYTYNYTTSCDDNFWHNTNFEVQSSRYGSVHQLAINSRKASSNLANYGISYSYNSSTGLYTIQAEMAVPYEMFGVSRGLDSYSLYRVAFRPGLNSSQENYINNEFIGNSGLWWSTLEEYNFTGAGLI